MQNEHLLPARDPSGNDTISCIPDVINDNSLNSHNNDNHLNICQNYLYPIQSSLTMTNESVCINEYELAEPIIKSSSNAEDTKLENEKVFNRVLRRKKKRQTTRVSKSKHNLIRENLEKQVRELEFKQNHLLSQVENLQLYKEQLELTCKQIYSNYKFIG
ncbi:unnamed protein product [Rotaria sp. Silwood1]|nr:unnamed protein product [Rotaria sp. Silwood1]CAF1211788.1 unnamed protein product [Rotaria sp. Silwood1]